MTDAPHSPQSPALARALQTVTGGDPLNDGRQSDRALAIARGTQRLLAALGHVSLPELVLPSFRRADLTVVTGDGQIWIVEIKSSVTDFRTDAKWPEYRDYCDVFAFAVAPDFPLEILPEGPGVVVADRFAAELIRPDAEPRRLTPARRKTMQLLFARAAAARLQRLADPEANLERLPSR